MAANNKHYIMSASDECDYKNFQSPLNSLSTVFSMEFVDTILPSTPEGLDKVLRPQDSKYLFELPSDQQIDSYNQIFPRIMNIIQELQETLPKVSIRDDYSLQPKAVSLRMPLKRNTLVS